jgi:hypothetical protein
MHPAPSPHPATARAGRRALATWLQPQRAEAASRNPRLPPALRDHPQAGSAATTTFAPLPKIFGVNRAKIFWKNNFSNAKIVKAMSNHRFAPVGNTR